MMAATMKLMCFTFFVILLPVLSWNVPPRSNVPRRAFVQETLLAVSSPAVGFLLLLQRTPPPANALVKGNAPPPKQKPNERRSCTNVEECQQMAEEREAAERQEQLSTLEPVSVTPQGTRYKDITVGSGTTKAQKGDIVRLYYKVLKLGKRSYDGISGEGTVVFSRGYGLEDDESSPRTKDFQTVLGNFNTIAALNDAIVGMTVGGIRRFAVTPDAGWRKPGKACDGGPGGAGAGGDLKTDFVVVPTATMVAAEACFDTTKQPFPTSYAQQRRMAQRFDQSLIMEVELVQIRPATENDLV